VLSATVNGVPLPAADVVGLGLVLTGAAVAGVAAARRTRAVALR